MYYKDVLVFFTNSIQDITLYAIDMHKNRLIALFWHSRNIRKLDRHCTMGLSIALRISKITKSKGPDFAQFWSKPSEAALVKWVAHCTKVIGSIPEDEQKAHKNTCFARSVLCTGSLYDSYAQWILSQCNDHITYFLFCPPTAKKIKQQKNTPYSRMYTRVAWDKSFL